MGTGIPCSLMSNPIHAGASHSTFMSCEIVCPEYPRPCIASDPIVAFTRRLIWLEDVAGWFENVGRMTATSWKACTT